MTRTDWHHPAPPRSFGKRLIRPLTPEEKAAAAAAEIESERAAMWARTEAYLAAQWDEQMASISASLREGEREVARRRLGFLAKKSLVGLGGAIIGWSIGSR